MKIIIILFYIRNKVSVDAYIFLSRASNHKMLTWFGSLDVNKHSRPTVKILG